MRQTSLAGPALALVAGLALAVSASDAAPPRCLNSDGGTGAPARALVASPCPSTEWQVALAEQPFTRPAPGEKQVLVNIGANKGYAIAEFVQTWTQRKLSNTAWHGSIRWGWG